MKAEVGGAKAPPGDLSSALVADGGYLQSLLGCDPCDP